MWEYHKFHCDWHYVIDPLILCSNVKIWNEFTPEDKNILLDCAKEMETYSKALSRLGQDPSYLAYLEKIGMVPDVKDPYQYLKDNGMQVVVPTKEAMDAFYTMTEDVRAKWTKKIGENLVNMAKDDMKSVE